MAHLTSVKLWPARAVAGSVLGEYFAALTAVQVAPTNLGQHEIDLKIVMVRFRSFRSWCYDNFCQPCMRKSAICAVCVAALLTIFFPIFGLVTGTFGGPGVSFLIAGLCILWVVVIYAIYSSHVDKKNVQFLRTLQEWRFTYELERRLAHAESDFSGISQDGSAQSAVSPVATNNPVLLQVVLPPVVAPSPPPPYEGPPPAYNSLISTPPPEYPGPGALV